MALTPPKDGDLITKGSIQDMFSTVKGTVNDIDETKVGRATFGPQHFKPGHAYNVGSVVNPANADVGGIVTNQDSSSFSPSSAVNITVATDSAAIDMSGAGEWQELGGANTALRLDGAGSSTSGYAIEAPGIVVVYFSLRLRKFVNVNEVAHVKPYLTWVGATYAINGGAETAVNGSIRCVTAEGTASAHPVGGDGSTSQNYGPTQEQNISCWYTIDLSSYTGSVTLNYLKIRAAKMLAGHGVGTGSDEWGASDNYHPEIANGYHMFFSLKST